MSEYQVPIPQPEAGVHPEIDQNVLPPTALHDAENWIMRDGRMRVREGFETIGGTVAGRFNGFCGYIDGDGTPVLLAATTTDVYAYDDATQAWVDLSATFTADANYHTIFRVFQLGTAGGETTTAYLQNGKDAPLKWAKGDPTVSAMGAAVPIARAMMVLADKMLVGNIVGTGGGTYAGALGPHVVASSNDLDPSTGYTAVTQLSDTPGAIVGMQESGNLQGNIYKTDAIYLATASDSAEPFTYELKRAGISGPVSPRAIVTASDGLQYYLARDGNVMVYDGIDPKPLGRHIQRHVLDAWDINVFHKAFGCYDDENRELVFYFCGVGSSEPNAGIRVRLDSSSNWPIRVFGIKITAAIKALLPGGTKIGSLSGAISTLGLTLGEYASLGGSFIFGSNAGQAYVEIGNDDNGSPIQHFFETGSSDLGMPLRFKSMRYIDHLFRRTTNAQNITITLKKDDYGEDMTSDADKTVSLSAAGPYRTFHRFPGRRYAIRMSGASTEPVEWSGSNAVFATQGRR